MNISIDEVKYIAKLAKLRFTDDEAKKMAKEFESVLGHFKSIDKLDLSDIDLNIYKEGAKSVVRNDEAVDYGKRDKLLSNVKSKKNGYIQVPKIIE